jgi:hypothetical protein
LGAHVDGTEARKLREGIADIIMKMGLKRRPLLPSDHTMSRMTKAPTALYEAAVENCRRSKEEK